MKKIIVTIVIALLPLIAFAQSEELKAAYKQVCTTLKEYKFEPLDDYGFYSDSEITLVVQNGLLVFTVYNGETLKVPANDVTFDASACHFSMESKNGIEQTCKGKKDLLTSYDIYGEELTLRKLCQELVLLQKIILEEDFKGSLGGGSTKKTTSQPKPAQQKNANTQAHPQPKPRNRVPAGN